MEVIKILFLWLTNGSMTIGGTRVDFTTNGFAKNSYFSQQTKDEMIETLSMGNYEFSEDED